MPAESPYLPLNVPKQIAEGIWIVDSPPIHVGGAPLPLRMTVLRLASGELLLHSPVQFSEALRHSVEALGPVRHLIAPSIGHWMFLQDWQKACPGAKTWAVLGLRDRSQVRAAGTRIDEVLGSTAPEPWADEVEQVLIQGPVFAEIDLFHKPSRTLVLSDLVVSLERHTLTVPARAMARLLGVVAPRGRAPAYLRLLLRMNRSQAAEAAARLVAFRPERVIFAHGQWFERNATARLRKSLDWLLDDCGRPKAMADRKTLPAVVAGVAIVGLIGAAALAARSRKADPE